MMKRLDIYAQAMVPAVFKDFRHLWLHRREYERDLSRLLSQLKSRGISLMTLDLPRLEKILHLSLDVGSYSNPHLVLTKSRKGEQIPIFLREVYLGVFSPQGVMVERPNPDSVLFLKTLFTLFKKINIECQDRYVREEKNAFKHTDANLPLPSLNWGDDDLGVEDGSRVNNSVSIHTQRVCPGPRDIPSRNLELYAQQCFDIVASSIGSPPSLRSGDSRNVHKPKHGPGSVSNLSFGNSKYRFPYWPNKLQNRFPFDEFSLPSFGQGFSYEESFGFKPHETPAKLIAVPKDIRKPRLIASEPTENQWIQQLISASLHQEFESNSLLSTSIKLKDQRQNQGFALMGSSFDTVSTLDLSEASDRMSLSLLECLFSVNSSWLIDLHSCRSKDIDIDGEIFRLRKFAPQGNACTFPVQTLLFFCLAIASVAYTRNMPLSRRVIEAIGAEVSVYGDDIIIPTDSVDAMSKILFLVGLKLNTSKSFWTGKFRESCGIDAFMGYDVTPPRLREVPRGLASVPSLVETSNSFYKKGFWNCSDAIREFFSKWDHMIPVRKDADVPICMISYSSQIFTGRVRRNKDLQLKEGKMLTIRSRLLEVQMEPHERIMQYFTENPEPDSNWKSGFKGSRSNYSIRPGWVTLQ